MDVQQNMLNDIVQAIDNGKIGNKAIAKSYLEMIKARELVTEVAQIILEVLTYSINENKPLAGTLSIIGQRVLQVLNIEEDDTAKIMRIGAAFIDILTKAGYVDIDTFPIIEKEGRNQWFIVCKNDDFLEYIKSHALPKLKANLGYHEWTTPIISVANRKIDIVKRARQYKLLSNYRYSEMPTVYNSLNKQGRTEWKINQDMLKFLDMEASDTNLVPKSITNNEKRFALSAINKNERTALWLSEVKFKQLTEVKGYNPEAAQRFADMSANDYKEEKNKKHLNIISKWSKEQDYRKCIRFAKEYGDDTLNFLYSCDSRGRSYVFNQSFLNPQGADHAKSLLVFAKPKKVSTYDLMITIANHAGQDKISYDDRIQWVKDNNINVLEVGSNPWSKKSMKFLNRSGIAQEKKSKLQFVAAAIEWKKLHDFIETGGNQDDFLCSVPIAYDGTNSGLQILSSVGRDDYIAPYVNITSTNKPGDVYQLIGNAVADKKPLEKLLPIESGAKTWRKIVKRNVMTKNYAATRYGMGDQQWEDKPEEQDDSTGIWHTLNSS